MTRAVVSVIRHAGDESIAHAIICGTVSREIRMMQAERDLLARRRREDTTRKIAEAREKYAVRRENPVIRAYCCAAAFFILLREEAARAGRRGMDRSGRRDRAADRRVRRRTEY